MRVILRRDNAVKEIAGRQPPAAEGLGYILEECPMSRGQEFFAGRVEEPPLRPCDICGQPSTAGTCKFCRQMTRADLAPLALQAAV